MTNGPIGKHTRRVGDRDDAYQIVSVNDRQPPDLVGAHGAEDIAHNLGLWADASSMKRID